MANNEMHPANWDGDEALKKIVRRALEIDQQATDFLSGSDIEYMAVELQISPSALNQAIQESRLDALRAGMPVIPAERGAGFFAPSHATPLITAALAAATPVLVGSVVPLTTHAFILGSTVLTMFGVQAGVIALASQYDGEAKHQRWQLANIMAWFGFATGYVFLAPSTAGELWGFLAGFGGMSAVAGSGVIAIKEALRARRSADANSGDGSDGTSPWKERVLKRVARILDGPWAKRSAAFRVLQAANKPEFI